MISGCRQIGHYFCYRWQQAMTSIAKIPWYPYHVWLALLICALPVCSQENAAPEANVAADAEAAHPSAVDDPARPWSKSASAEIVTETEIIERVRVATDRALAYIADQQQPDGTWDGNNAPNALALLALMGRGHVPGRGPYSDVIEKGKRAILRTQDERGVFVPSRTASSGPMYQHALATLAMAEMYGMDPDPELEDKLRKAINLIVQCQFENGGWRYNAEPGDHDLSATVMQIVALRAANNAEIPVPTTTIEKAVGYVQSCVVEAGGYAYQPTQIVSPQMAAAGTVSLQLLGYFDDPTIPKALDYLTKVPVEWATGHGVRYYFYFHYYAIQANYQAGGEYWANWHPRVREMFLAQQNPDGSWDNPAGGSENAGTVGDNKVYWTAMSSLILEIYMHFLPAYQR
jgi:hypothetical protein